MMSVRDYFNSTVSNGLDSEDILTKWSAYFELCQATDFCDVDCLKWFVEVSLQAIDYLRNTNDLDEVYCIRQLTLVTGYLDYAKNRLV